jgi:hypothetical protein
MAIRTINLRDLPEEFVRRAKACAALHGVTLKAFVVDAVEKAIEKDIPARSIAATLLGQRARPHKGRQQKKTSK